MAYLHLIVKISQVLLWTRNITFVGITGVGIYLWGRAHEFLTLTFGNAHFPSILCLLILLPLIIFYVSAKLINKYIKNNSIEAKISGNLLLTIGSIFSVLMPLLNLFNFDALTGQSKLTSHLTTQFTLTQKQQWLLEIKNLLNANDLLWERITSNINLLEINNYDDLLQKVQQNLIIMQQNLPKEPYNGYFSVFLNHPAICTIIIVGGITLCYFWYSGKLNNLLLETKKGVIELGSQLKEQAKIYVQQNNEIKEILAKLEQQDALNTEFRQMLSVCSEDILKANSVLEKVQSDVTGVIGDMTKIRTFGQVEAQLWQHVLDNTQDTGNEKIDLVLQGLLKIMAEYTNNNNNAKI